MSSFTPARLGCRVTCDACGRAGYPGGRWQRECEAGHPFTCWCGRVFTSSSGLTAHTHPRRPGAAPRHQEDA